MDRDLEELSALLFHEISSSFPKSAQKLLLSKWDQIRDIAAQNGGHRSWKDHLLKLDPKGIEDLKETFRSTIHCVEAESLNLKEIADSELHFLLDPATEFHFDKKAAKALFLEYNPEFVAEFRLQFQKIFQTLHSLENWQRRDPLVAQMLIGNLISFLPLLDFEEGSKLSLLRYIEGKWEFIDYKVVHIPLIAGKINAYGLEPESAEAFPILVFQSTPYPAASGFLEAILSELHPTKSVGETIFECGRGAIEKWLTGKPKVECYGMSLGGSLAYHTGHAFGEKLEVHAYVAPGITRSMSQIRGRSFFHHKDLINLVGTHPESKHFEVFSVLTETDVNFLQAHAIPPGIEPTVVLKINPQYENRTVPRVLFTCFKIIIVAPFWLPLVVLRGCVELWKRVKD